MADWVTWVPLVVTIILAGITYFQQNRVIRQQAEELSHQAEQLKELRKGRQRELIMKYYSPLAENLRHTVKEFHNNYMGIQGQYDEFFNVLIKMRNDSTLKIIESLDSGLYEKCLEILDTHIPKLDILHSQRHATWPKIQSFWTSWMSLNFNLFPSINVTPEQFTKNLVQSSLWYYWRNEDEYAQARLKEACERAFSLSDDSIEVRIMLFEEFKGISENEWSGLRERFTETYSELRELVTSIILPRIDDTMKRIGA
jgi:hypothetical protein